LLGLLKRLLDLLLDLLLLLAPTAAESANTTCHGFKSSFRIV
jgi:hypothetical protein